MLSGNVILALSFLKSDHRNVLGFGERLKSRNELSGYLGHHGRRGQRLLAIAEEPDYSAIGLQTRHLKVQVEAVDAFHFQGHMLANDLSYLW